MKFLCDQCKAKYQIADEKAAGKTVRMKCRKCGHLIEVRAAVSEPPPDEGARQSGAPAAPRAPQKAPPPRASTLATSLASAKPPAKPGERPASALAGAFKSSVQREDETSAPFDMADLSPSDEWYVAINGVPVGPIRVAEIRRKAALGAVTEDSLCWQEGLDEWRPVRSFPELSMIVLEALASGRSSLPPAQPEGRVSQNPARPATGPSAMAPATSVPRPAGGLPPRAPQPRPVAAPAPAVAVARSNVVPITSRLATAEKFEDLIDDRTRPANSPLADAAVVADPFANPPAPAVSMPAPIAGATQSVLALSDVAAGSIAAPPAPAKSVPWMAIAMVVGATAFGVTAAIAVFVRPAPAATPAALAAQTPGAATNPSAPATAATAQATGVPTDTTTPPDTSAAPGSTKPGGGGAVSAKAAPAATSAGAVGGKGPLDLGGLGGNVRPSTDDTNDGPKAAGQCFSSGQVSQVIGLHQPGIRRACWERNPTTKPTVNVNVSLNIGPDGAPQSVSANADEPSIAKCVENDVRTWRFPAMGCSQQTGFSFHFVRQ